MSTTAEIDPCSPAEATPAPLAPSADALAKQGLEYLKGKIQQYRKK
jgi:hypothetical protein